MLLLKFYILSVAAAFNYINVKSSDLSEIKLIRNYVEKQVPVQTTFYTCWPKQKIVKLVEEMVKSKISISIVTNFSKVAEKKPTEHELIISDAKCVQFEYLLDTAENLNFFKPPHRWLILNYINNTVSPTRKILVDSNFAIATKDSDNAFQLRLIYKLTENDTDFVYNELGKFSDDFEYYNHFLTAMNRSDLMGSIVTVSYVLTSPAYPIDFVNYRNQHIDGVSKLSYALVFHMLELLNCTKNFIERKSWGYKHQNATYYDGGMFGDIQNGTAEIAGTVAFYTFGRMEVVDYISVTTPSDMKFILRAPPLSYINNLFTLPFEINVWYGLYLITGFTIILLYVIVIYESKYKESFKKANNVENIKPTFVDVIMLQIGAITQQGSEAEPKSSSGRIAVFIVFLVLMFMYTAYAANIVVLLQSTSNSFQTVQDLLYSKINLGVEDIVYSKYYFENQQEPIRKAIYEQKIAPKDQKPNFFSVQDGIRKMRNEFFAFHIETTSGYKVVMDTFQEHEKCGLIEIDYLNTLWPSISVRKRSAYKEIVKVGFRKIYESGIRYRQTNRIYYKKPLCRGKGGSFTSVGIIDAYFPFIIFSIGILLSLWLLLIEILFGKYHQYGLRQFKNLKIKFKWGDQFTK